MLTFAARRLILVIPVALGVMLLTFLLLHMTPGDPAQAIAGPDASPEVVEQIRQQLGLDRPLPAQFMGYLTRVLRGDLGDSIISRQSVAGEIQRVFAGTMELVIAAVLWSIPVAILIGTAAAVWRGTVIDKGLMALALMGLSIPIYWTGLILIWFLSFKLNLFPISGRGGPIWTLKGIHYLLLPALTLGTVLVGSTARLTRATMLEVLRNDFVRTARAKGVSQRIVLFKHALRNASLPIITLIGLQLGSLLGGAVVTETVFTWPGMGRMVVRAILSKDFPVVQGIVLVMALLFLTINLVVDLLYAVLDPRVRYT